MELSEMFYDDETAIALRENGITISSEGTVRVATFVDDELFEHFMVTEDAPNEVIGGIVWDTNKRFLTNGCGVRVVIDGDWDKSEQGTDPFEGIC